MYNKPKPAVGRIKEDGIWTARLAGSSTFLLFLMSALSIVAFSLIVSGVVHLFEFDSEYLKLFGLEKNLNFFVSCASKAAVSSQDDLGTQNAAYIDVLQEECAIHRLMISLILYIVAGASLLAGTCLLIFLWSRSLRAQHLTSSMANVVFFASIFGVITFYYVYYSGGVYKLIDCGNTAISSEQYKVLTEKRQYICITGGNTMRKQPAYDLLKALFQVAAGVIAAFVYSIGTTILIHFTPMGSSDSIMKVDKEDFENEKQGSLYDSEHVQLPSGAATAASTTFQSSASSASSSRVTSPSPSLGSLSLKAALEKQERERARLDVQKNSFDNVEEHKCE